MSQLLLSKIAGVRSKHVSVAVGTGIAAMVGAFVVCLTVGMLLDWWLDLPRWVRAAFLAIDLALLVVLLFRNILLPIVFGPDDDQIALRVEDAAPVFRTRLIASLQLSRRGAVPAGASVSMVRAMIAQTESVAKGVDFSGVVKTDRLVKLTVASILVLVLGTTGLVWGRGGGTSFDLLKRAFLANVPVPRKTRIQTLSPQFTVAVRLQQDLADAVSKSNAVTTTEEAGDLTVARGDIAVLGGKALGIIPTGDPRNSVEVRFDSSRKQQFPLDPLPADKTLFTRSLENVQDSFSYRLNLGDSTTPWYRVTTLAPPAVTRIDCQQVYPEYTRIGTVGRSLGDLSVLAGSRLVLRVTSNNRLQPGAAGGQPTNFVHLVGSEQNVAMKLDPVDPHLLMIDLAIPEKTTGFSIVLTDEHGLRSKDPAVYRIDLVPDKEPTIRVTYPEQKEELATKVASVDIGFDAVDDYGISKVTLKYKVDDGQEKSVPLAVGADQPKNMRNVYKWSMSRISTTSTTRPSLEGSNVEYWLEAEDNNNVTGPGKGESEHFQIRIVTEAEKRAEILARLGSSIENLKTTVEDQKKLHDDLGAMILERKPDQP